MPNCRRPCSPSISGKKWLRSESWHIPPPIVTQIGLFAVNFWKSSRNGADWEKKKQKHCKTPPARQFGWNLEKVTQNWNLPKMDWTGPKQRIHQKITKTPKNTRKTPKNRQILRKWRGNAGEGFLGTHSALILWGVVASRAKNEAWALLAEQTWQMWNSGLSGQQLRVSWNFSTFLALRDVFVMFRQKWLVLEAFLATAPFGKFAFCEGNAAKTRSSAWLRCETLKRREKRKAKHTDFSMTLTLRHSLCSTDIE